MNDNERKNGPTQADRFGKTLWKAAEMRIHTKNNSFFHARCKVLGEYPLHELHTGEGSGFSITLLLLLLLLLELIFRVVILQII